MNDRDARADLFGGARLLVLFDGYCGVCTRCVAWIQVRNRAGRIRPLPNQLPGLRQRFGLSRDRVDREVVAITPEGAVYGGAAAFQQIAYALGQPWSWLGRCYDLPGASWCADRAYAVFARHRGRFARLGITPACEHAGVPCEPEGR